MPEGYVFLLKNGRLGEQAVCSVGWTSEQRHLGLRRCCSVLLLDSFISLTCVQLMRDGVCVVNNYDMNFLFFLDPHIGQVIEESK